MWQFLCNEEHTIEDLMLVTLKQAYELDPSIGEIKDLPLGKDAWREHPQLPWRSYN